MLAAKMLVSWFFYYSLIPDRTAVIRAAVAVAVDVAVAIAVAAASEPTHETRVRLIPKRGGARKICCWRKNTITILVYSCLRV